MNDFLRALRCGKTGRSSSRGFGLRVGRRKDAETPEKAIVRQHHDSARKEDPKHGKIIGKSKIYSQ
jgi:hypothetical protein